MSWQYMPLHWGLVSITIDPSKADAESGVIAPLEAEGKSIPLTGSAQPKSIVGMGGSRKIKSGGKAQSTKGSGGVCG